jgi:DNA polymerase III subunit delta
MVAIPTGRVAIYVRNPELRLRGFLLHGTDSGLIRENAAALCQQLAAGLPDTPDTITLSEDDLSADPDQLAIEAQTVSMFASNKILRVRASGRLQTELAKFAWERVPDGVRIVVEAGNLKRDAKLRTLFEKAKTLVALPCHDGTTATSLTQLIDAEMSAAGLAIAHDARDHLASLLGADIGVAKAEIAKLKTYAYGTSNVTIDDIDAVIGDSAQSTLDAAVDAALAGSHDTALSHLDKLRAAGTPPDVLLAALSQHILRLLRLRAKIDAGASADAALKSFRPPVHFRRADQMKMQIRNWDGPRLRRALDLISRALKHARKNQAIAHQISADAMLRLHASRAKQATTGARGRSSEF